MQKKKEKKLRFGCSKCAIRFSSWQRRDQHAQEFHKPPQKTEKRFIRTGESHNLINGLNLKLGDKVLFTKKGVITKITLTEGSNVASVEVSVIKDSWGSDD